MRQPTLHLAPCRAAEKVILNEIFGGL